MKGGGSAGSRFLGDLLLDDGRATEAEAVYRELEALSRQNAPPTPAFVAGAFTGLGTALSRLGPWRATRAKAGGLREAMAIDKSLGTSHSVQAVRATAALADVLQHVGRPATAPARGFREPNRGGDGKGDLPRYETDKVTTGERGQRIWDGP